LDFTYEALNRQGESITGKVVANSTSEAYEKLREAGVVVTSLKENAAKTKKKGGKKDTLNPMLDDDNNSSLALDTTTEIVADVLTEIID
jgi:type II secretory pathway component PulF